MPNIILRGMIGLIAIFVLFLVGFKLANGMGAPYPDVSTEPIIKSSNVTAAIRLPFPPGMVTVSRDGRIFYSYHMLHKPERFSEATSSG